MRAISEKRTHATYGKCQVCAELFQADTPSHTRRRKFCSPVCYAEYRHLIYRFENHPKWKGGEHRYNCEQCGSVFFDAPSNHRRYCSHECYWASLVIDGGQKEWRKKVFARDGWTCCSCGSHKKLNAHHIFFAKQYPLLSRQPWNGITLCSVCHRRYHLKTMRLAGML